MTNILISTLFQTYEHILMDHVDQVGEVVEQLEASMQASLGVGYTVVSYVECSDLLLSHPIVALASHITFISY